MRERTEPHGQQEQATKNNYGKAVLANTDDGSTGNTDVVYVPYKMVAHWPSCLEPMGYKNNMEEEPQPYAREVVFSEA